MRRHWRMGAYLPAERAGPNKQLGLSLLLVDRRIFWINSTLHTTDAQYLSKLIQAQLEQCSLELTLFFFFQCSPELSSLNPITKDHKFVFQESQADPAVHFECYSQPWKEGCPKFTIYFDHFGTNQQGDLLAMWWCYGRTKRNVS